MTDNTALSITELQQKFQAAEEAVEQAKLELAYQLENGVTDAQEKTPMDEQETKLDLAKAYFDMGDGEAAKAILEDVAECGNEMQKQEASDIFARIEKQRYWENNLQELERITAKAAEYGHAESQYWLSYYLLTGGIMEQDLEPLTHSDRYRVAINLADNAAKGGCLEAKLILGFMRRFGFISWLHDDFFEPDYAMDIAIEDFEGAVGHTDKGIAEYFLYEHYRHSDDPKKLVLANKYEKQADIGKVWEYFKIDKLIEMDGSLKEKLAVLLKDAELIQKNKDLERVNLELEELMAMFAHKFRSPLDAIIYNTTHENQSKLYIEAAQTMRGLLDVFSAISTDSEILRERIRQDNQGQGRVLTLFLKTLDMLMLHLLSPTGAKKIRQHYLAHAKAQGQCAHDLSYKAWREDFYELEQQMQAEWEQSYAQLLNQSESLEPRLAWVEQHFFKLELPGFDNEEIQFEPNEFKESFLMILLNEILVNAFKYYSSETKQPVVLEWHERDGYQVLSCHNPSVRSERSIIKGSGKGHVFLSTLARKTGSQFVKPKLQDDFVLEFGIPNDLLLTK